MEKVLENPLGSPPCFERPPPGHIQTCSRGTSALSDTLPSAGTETWIVRKQEKSTIFAPPVVVGPENPDGRFGGQGRTHGRRHTTPGAPLAPLKRHAQLLNMSPLQQTCPVSHDDHYEYTGVIHAGPSITGCVVLCGCPEIRTQLGGKRFWPANFKT